MPFTSDDRAAIKLVRGKGRKRIGSKKNFARVSEQAVVANHNENGLPGQRHQLQ